MRKVSRTVAKQKNSRFTKRFKTIVTISCLVVSTTMLLLGVLLLTPSHALAQSQTQLSPAKQDLVDSQVKWHAQFDGYKSTKIAKTPSCPMDLNQSAKFIDMSSSVSKDHQISYMSFANVVSSEKMPYFIYGKTDQINVEVVPLDPCKTNFFHTSNQKSFRTPKHEGDIIVTSVQGDVVLYRTSTGTTGAFNFVTGQFQ